MLKDERLPLKKKFLEYYRKLPIQKLAGASIGRSEDTITDWKREDSDFSDQVELARSQWAMEKSEGVKSKEWLLERIMKDHFAQRNEMTGKEGKDLPTPTFQIMSEDGKKQLEKLYERPDSPNS